MKPQLRIHMRPDGRLKRVENLADGSDLCVAAVDTHQSADNPFGTVTLTFHRPHVEFVEATSAS